MTELPKVKLKTPKTRRPKAKADRKVVDQAVPLVVPEKTDLARVTKKLLLCIKRHHRPVVAFVVGVIVMITFASFPRETVVVNEIADTAVATSTDTAKEVISLERSLPTELSIPAIGVEAKFADPLGLNADGTIEVPKSYEEVGWYQYGPTPGERGPAVILGHVDSYQGPAVFFSLGQLKEGDEILIERTDGKTATFTVERLERHTQHSFPTKEVYGDIDHAGLRIITCTGVYSHATLRYSHNLIVFARLVEE
jgi:sortase (surface protein transpeptidase)